MFIPQVIHEHGEPRWNDINRENRITPKKICPSATLSTINPAWNNPGTNSDLRDERPANNRLIHGTVLLTYSSDLPHLKSLLKHVNIVDIV
jgi:hypothetical protein